jgi:hypothetical protein
MLNGKTQRVYGWPEQGYPAPQGPFYCGVGSESVFGRPLAEAHLEACMKAGLNISGINSEVCTPTCMHAPCSMRRPVCTVPRSPSCHLPSGSAGTSHLAGAARTVGVPDRPRGRPGPGR